jgi:hypothetical protein
MGRMSPVFCTLTSSLGLWLELNLQLNPSALASPYVFAFSDDITVPSGGQKAKEQKQKRNNLVDYICEKLCQGCRLYLTRADHQRGIWDRMWLAALGSGGCPGKCSVILVCAVGMERLALIGLLVAGFRNGGWLRWCLWVSC